MLKINKLIAFCLIVLVLLAGSKLAHDHLETPQWVAVALNAVFGSGGEAPSGMEAAQANPVPDGTPVHSQDTVQPGSTSASTENAAGHPVIDDKKLAELIDKHISPGMRDQINEMLRPGGNPPNLIERGDERILDTSDRAGTVVVGIIDENDELVVTDFTHPLSVEQNNQ